MPRSKSAGEPAAAVEYYCRADGEQKKPATGTESSARREEMDPAYTDAGRYSEPEEAAADGGRSSAAAGYGSGSQPSGTGPPGEFPSQ